MAFKLGKPPYTYDPTPVYHTPMEKGKTYSRSKMNEGDSALPWEAEAYRKTK